MTTYTRTQSDVLEDCSTDVLLFICCILSKEGDVGNDSEQDGCRSLKRGHMRLTTPKANFQGREDRKEEQKRTLGIALLCIIAALNSLAARKNPMNTGYCYA